MAELYDVISKRKSYYTIGKNTDVTIEEVVEALRNIADKLPSSFNCQSSRFVVVSGETNDRIWDIIDEDAKGFMDEETYSNMAPTYERAKGGLGTVLLFESTDAIATMPSKKTRANEYKENNHGIAAYATWLVLREMGLGATLQHHNIGYEKGYDKGIREYLKLPEEWELKAQMPFGSIEAEEEEKPKMDVKEQVISR